MHKGCFIFIKTHSFCRTNKSGAHVSKHNLCKENDFCLLSRVSSDVSLILEVKCCKKIRIKQTFDLSRSYSWTMGITFDMLHWMASSWPRTQNYPGALQDWMNCHIYRHWMRRWSKSNYTHTRRYMVVALRTAQPHTSQAHYQHSGTVGNVCIPIIQKCVAPKGQYIYIYI